MSEVTDKQPGNKVKAAAHQAAKKGTTSSHEREYRAFLF